MATWRENLGTVADIVQIATPAIAIVAVAYRSRILGPVGQVLLSVAAVGWLYLAPLVLLWAVLLVLNVLPRPCETAEDTRVRRMLLTALCPRCFWPAVGRPW